MSEAIIRVENLGKRYRLGAGRSNARYTALRDVIADSISAPFRRLRNGRRSKTEDRSSAQSSNSQLPSTISHLPSSPASPDFWALRDINFEVKQGEVLGIIGRNGAGKSTLLKILSRITEPTEGRVKIKGRVASLLEVGTGFHPELTGRENIYLNGAILGMHRSEIKAKFDEIVAFAEVEKFLDTPVKRYSSGMYVRLAFAVAAHLEPEILVVDEVLAVGDAQFQKKCLEKMRDVAKEGGRTVLFVSHNMAAVQTLCTRCVLLERGEISFDGSSGGAIKRYLNSDSATTNKAHANPLSDSLTLSYLECSPSIVQQHGDIKFRLAFESSKGDVINDLALLLQVPTGERAALIDLRSIAGPVRLAPGAGFVMEANVSGLSFVENDFSVGLYVNADSVCHSFMNLLTFSVVPSQGHAGMVPRDPQFRGLVELRAVISHQVAAA